MLGAGPAGASFALSLAPRRRVLVLDRHAAPQPRVGESLPAAAGRMLRDMGVWERFLADGHLASYGRCSVWGGGEAVETDSLRDLDGHGWQLDRVRFEQMLRRAAVERGAEILAPAWLIGVEQHGCEWRAEIMHEGRSYVVTAGLLVDARGRAARPMAAFQAQRRISDRLICGWAVGVDNGGTEGAGIIYTEAEAEGWWYTAALPGGSRILALHSDADLPASADARNPAALIARAGGMEGLVGRLAGVAFDAPVRSGFCAAHSCRLEPACGPGWFAVGDAAMAVDPLASQGLLTALYTGLVAAKAADRVLSGDGGVIEDYRERLAAIWDAYRQRLAATYAQEQRWRARAFWQRRRLIPGDAGPGAKPDHLLRRSPAPPPLHHTSPPPSALADPGSAVRRR